MKYKRRLQFILAFLILFPGLSLAAEKIAVLDLINKSGLEENDVYFLTEQVRGQVARSLPSSSYSIMTRENIFELLPPGTDLKKCTEAECEVQIGRQLGAAYIVTGDVLTYAGEYRIILKVHHSKSGSFLGEKTVSAANLKSLESEAKSAADAIAALIRGRARTGVTQGAVGATPEAWDLPTAAKEVVRFESIPEGAVVMADGRLLCQSTPCSRELALGSVSIVMEKEKHFPEEKIVDVEKNMPPVSWSLKPNYGWLNVTSKPSGMSVRINGEVAGKTPLQSKILDPGAYEVMVTDPRYYEKGERFNIAPGDKKDISVNLPPRLGAIDVSAKDAQGNAVKGEVFLDGQSLGQAPSTMKVIIGEHELEVRTPYGSWRGQVEVLDKKVTNVRAEVKGVITAAPVVPSPASPAKFERSGKRKTLGWSLTGAGAGLVVLGGASYFYLLATQQNDEFKDASDTDDAESARDSGQTYEYLGYAGMGAGLVVAGVGIYYLATPSSGKRAGADRAYFAGYSPAGGKHQLVLGIRY